MMVLISYDISCDDKDGQRRLRQVARACQDYGMRVQYSVFECEIDPARWVVLKDRLLSLYRAESDSLRFYMLGSKWRTKVEHHGAKKTADIFRDGLII